MQHLGQYYLPGDKDFRTYDREWNSLSPTTESLVLKQVLEWLGTFEECVAFLSSTHPHLSATQMYLQYHEWIHNVLRMQRRIRYGVYQRMKHFDSHR